MTAKVIVTIGRDGSVSAETRGIVGSACLDVIPLLEDLLGGQVIDSALTPDYAQASVERTTVDSDHRIERLSQGDEA